MSRSLLVIASSLAAICLTTACGLKPKDETSPVAAEMTNISNFSTSSDELSTAAFSPQNEEGSALNPSVTSPSEPKCLPLSERRKLAQAKAAPKRELNRTLSSNFLKNCAGCHGSDGKGRGDFPAINAVSYQNLVYSVRNGRSGVMPAFDEQKYPATTLDLDFEALTGSAVPEEEAVRCPVDKSGDNEEIAPALSYRQIEPGPKARGLGFALDPFVLPYVTCKELPALDGSGRMEKVCANVGISGSTEEGYRYADFGVCKDIRTQRPFRSIPVKNRNGRTDGEERLKDPEFAKELAWVTSQVRSSGCVCCHDSSVDKRASFWDINKDAVWTDQLDKYAVEIFTGRVDSTALGAYKPKENFGFDRYHTGLPTTDVARMQAFFKGLSQDLGTTDEEIKAMPPLADFLASQLTKDPEMCGKGIGVDADSGKITWKLGPVPFVARLVPARFIYILDEDAQTPLVTPNLDKPRGTLWRLDAKSFFQGFRSGTVNYGEVPRNGQQTIPDPERFPAIKPLEKGKTYRLVVQLDVAFPLTNCLFTYGQ